MSTFSLDLFSFYNFSYYMLTDLLLIKVDFYTIILNFISKFKKVYSFPPLNYYYLPKILSGDFDTLQYQFYFLNL